MILLRKIIKISFFKNFIGLGKKSGGRHLAADAAK